MSHPKREIDVFPQADALLASYAEREGVDEHALEVAREVFYGYLDRALKHTKIFQSKSGVEFPYTSVSLRELAEEIFVSNRGMRLSSEPQPEQKRAVKKEFLMTGFPTTSEVGGPFEFSEMPLHNLTALLPQALEDLKWGREVKDYTVYTLGYPTNEFGKIPPASLETFRERPLSVTREMYAEFIEQEVARTGTAAEDMQISLTGISTGSSVAAETGCKLLNDNAVTQTDEDKPHLAVTMYAPAGVSNLNTSPLRGAQVAGGFVGEGAQQALQNPRVQMIGKLQPGFFAAVRERLANRMPVQMDAEQKSAKRSGLMALAGALLKGAPVPENVKVTRIVGLDDSLVYSQERADEVAARSKEQKLQSGTWGPLQGRALPRENENERTFAINMPHLIPFYRESELSRIDGVVQAVANLKNQAK